MNQENKAVAVAVANLANELVPDLIDDSSLPGINTRSDALVAIESAVTQDRWTTSWRVAAALLGVLTATLALPEIQVLIGPWGAIATALLGALSAAVSKIIDPRPTR
jgi:hypothetical protein